MAARLVLASASPRRAALLARLGLHPERRPVDVDERPADGEVVDALTARLATTKALAAVRDDSEVVLAADTVVTIDGQLLGKPGDRTEATTMLRRLAGRTHRVVTGVAVVHGPEVVTTHATTSVTFRRLTDDEIAWYVATGEPDDKAGAYGLQGAGAVLVERIDGSDTNVVGLPLAETIALLRQVGVEPLT